MTERCEPKEADRRRDHTVHYIQCNDGPKVLASWVPDRSENSFSGYWWIGLPGKKVQMIYCHTAGDRGWRYLHPVSPHDPADIVRLVQAARVMRQHIKTKHDMTWNTAGFDPTLEQRLQEWGTALAAFTAKET